MPSHLSMISLLCFSISYVSAQEPMIDYWGRVVTATDRPLLIASFEGASRLFAGPGMMEEGFQLGFINRLAIDVPQYFLAPVAIGSKEGESIARTHRYSAMVEESGRGIDFNGRIVIWGHGGLDTSFSTPIISTPHGGHTTTSEFGHELGQYLQRMKIQPNQIDFIACHGELNGPELRQGLEESGVTNVTVRAYRGSTEVGLSGRTPVFRLHNDGATHEIAAWDFFLNGNLPGAPEDWQLNLPIGTPSAPRQTELPQRHCTIL